MYTAGRMGLQRVISILFCTVHRENENLMDDAMILKVGDQVLCTATVL